MNWHERYIQQAAWTRELRSYVFEKVHLPEARRVLEVGCGTGAVLGDLIARPEYSKLPEHHRPSFHGLDLAQASLRQCREYAATALLTCGDALSLPYPHEIFDITYCHFLLLWIPDSLRALQEMKRVTMRSGYVLALAEPDYTARIDKPPELAWLGQQQNQALIRQGAALGRGAELGDLFHRAGIRLIETGRILPADNHTLTQVEWESEWKVLEADLKDSLPPAEIRRMQNLDSESWRRGERILNVPTYFAWGQV